MAVLLPSRYEDLDKAFRGRLRPVPSLLEAVQRARTTIQVSGGLRFLPLFGHSGSGKSSAAGELATHLPQVRVLEVPREAIREAEVLRDFMRTAAAKYTSEQLLVAVVDQYEEAVATTEEIPTRFVEALSLLDRDRAFTERAWLFLWLTTSREFQGRLVAATSRNRRILLQDNFELHGPEKNLWTAIIEETFEFHNNGRNLADSGVLRGDIDERVKQSATLGTAMEAVGGRLAETLPALQDLSTMQVVMLWPVTDGQRINTILRFVDAREGYRLDWNAWFRELNESDQKQLPLAEYNRARLYFDMRLVPIAAADLHPLCKNLDDDEFILHRSYLEQFASTHYFSIIRGSWDPSKYSPLRERESTQRAENARKWYATVTDQPTKIGKRLARVLTELGLTAAHEVTIKSSHGTVRADIRSERQVGRQSVVLTELKAYAPEGTMPSSIREAVRTTLRRHAQFAGFLSRQ